MKQDTLYNNPYKGTMNVIIIQKNGDLTEKRTKHIDEENYYKICSFKTNKDFSLIHKFKYQNNYYSIYGKDKGKATHENKYELPPPVDSKLYFGNMCIIKLDENEEYGDLHICEWDTVYESLFGGFEDIGSKDESRSMDSEIYDDEDYTKEGYLKDDLIVDDDELQEEDYMTDSDEED